MSKAIFYLAWRYLAYHKFKTIILATSLTLIVYLPWGLRVLATQSARSLSARAETTPLIVGAKGSPLELVLNSLYFAAETPPPARYAEVSRIADSGFAAAIPLNTQFRARSQPIVGTTVDYFDFRGLRIERGRTMAMLGECVVGAKAARALEVQPDDSVVSSPENAFDLAGAYPLKMRVTGVLERTGMPDDLAVFADIRTTWAIAGLAHGHEDLTGPEAASAVLRRDGDVVIANASVVQHNEITPENVDSFHFHGDAASFPITAIIAVPRDVKSATLLRGRYLSNVESVQIVEPTVVVQDLVATVFTVQRYVVVAFAVVGVATLATAALVFALSIRLRRREIEAMHRIGAARGTVLAMLGAEIAVVLLIAVGAAAVLVLVTSWFGAAAVRWFVA